MKNIVFYFIIILLFIFNINEIDSNTDKVVNYDRNNLYEQDTYKLYFKNINSYELEKILKLYDIKVNKYIIDDEIYYASNINELIDIYSEDKTFKEKVYYELNGINIDGIIGLIDNYKVLSLEREKIIY